MTTFNTLADSLERARAQGIRDGRNQVMQIVRAALPGTDADEIESRLIEATTVIGAHQAGVSNDQGNAVSRAPTTAADSPQRPPQAESPD